MTDDLAPNDPDLPHVYGDLTQYRRNLRRQADSAGHLLDRLDVVTPRVEKAVADRSWIVAELEERQWTDEVERWRANVWRTTRRYLDRGGRDTLPITTQDWPPRTGKPRHERRITWIEPWLRESRAELLALEERLAADRTSPTRRALEPPMTAVTYEYDVALSFAGEQRPYVDEVAAALKEAGISVFYDAYETVNLWGKNLYDHLADVYGRRARHVVMFASAEYAAKAWTNHERVSAQAKALNARYDFLLPARFDDTTIPGLAATIGYIDLRSTNASELAGLIAAKVRASQT